MSKRKREDGGAQDPRERMETKRQERERRVTAKTADDEVISTHEPSVLPVDGVSKSQASSDGAKSERRSTKIERRKERREGKVAIATPSRDLSKQSHLQANEEKERKHQKRELKKSKRKHHDREEKRQGRDRGREPQWSVSVPVGGQMLGLDPLFSLGEEYLLLAYDTATNVYSISTSLLVRRLRIKSGVISGFAFSALDSSRLYVSTSSGLIERWDWVNGIRLGLWNTKVPIHGLTIPGTGSGDGTNGLVYTVDRHKEDRWLITGHRLVGAEEAAKTDLVVLLNHHKPLTSLKIVVDGRIIVATAGSSIIVGTTDHADQPSLKDITYVWREFQCSEWVTSIDIRVDDGSMIPNTPKNPNNSGNGLNIVVGGLKGAIFVYEDILRKLWKKETRSQRSNKDEISPRRLHWHRNAVSALKWSADGNYVISGGDETVLVLWQLETGQNQFLPHLSAAIESIVVSPKGSSYGIRLADNSAMILSTSELQPTFSIAGIQVPAIRERKVRGPFLPTVNRPRKTSQNTQYQRLPATVTPHGGSRLLLAVPATASLDAPKHACYLQTVDMVLGQQIARQALTRTNVTSLNIGPESNKIDEPSVKHIGISHDGQWLATVDEWAPPRRDLAHLAHNPGRAETERKSQLEVHLKFWSWDEASHSWLLVSRIDSPHATPVGDSCRVIELASDPTVIGFATLGEDSTVRVWKPTIRKRHGLDVRATDGTALTNWSCRQVIEFPTEAGSLGRVGYSADGSVLFAAIESTIPSAVHLIDTESGEVRTSPEGLFRGPLFNLGILDKYLIILSDELCVWDMVSDVLEFGLSFDPGDQNLEERRTTTHLAIDHKHNSFAVAVPDVSSRQRARVAVFRPDRPAPVFTTWLPSALTSLQPTAGRRGYCCIDTAAEIRTLMPTQSLPIVITSSVSSHAVSDNGLANIYGSGNQQEGKSGRSALRRSLMHVQPLQEQGETDRVISQAQLSEILEAGSATSLLPVADLFERVAVLFTER